MCVAIMKTDKASIGITEFMQKLEIGFQNNPDGAGYSYPAGESVVIRKPYFNWETFKNDFLKDWQENNLNKENVMVHFRITTSGKNDKLNTHPHRINKEWSMCHNGVISGVGDKSASDTVWLKNKIAQSPEIDLELLEVLAVNSSSKFVFLGVKEYIIMNEKAGNWENGVWYSNTSCNALKYRNKYGGSWNQDWDNYGFYGKSYTPKVHTPSKVPAVIKENEFYKYGILTFEQFSSFIKTNKDFLKNIGYINPTESDLEDVLSIIQNGIEIIRLSPEKQPKSCKGCYESCITAESECLELEAYLENAFWYGSFPKAESELMF